MTDNPELCRRCQEPLKPHERPEGVCDGCLKADMAKWVGGRPFTYTREDRKA